MISSKQELLAFFHREHRRIRDFGVAKIALFGSFAQNTVQSESDVDVFVEFQPGCKTFRSFMGLVQFLEDSIGRSVDLLTKESLSPYIGPKIMREMEYVSLPD